MVSIKEGAGDALRHKRRPGREGVVLEGEVRTAATAGARVREEQSAERGARSAGRMQREEAAWWRQRQQ